MSSSSTIEKPSVDKREYRHFQIGKEDGGKSSSSPSSSNMMDVLLISDPETDKAAASLDVYVGQLCDGEDPGIAHFLEHMIFMGNERYQDINEYDKYLSANGGSSNAFTDLEHTCYYFDVQAEQLDGALDRFANNFISPLFDQNALEREIQAVDSEHAKNANVDVWRMMQLSKSKIAPPGHSFGSFGSGNQESLPIDTIREKLLKFYEKHYRKSLGLYKLAVIGKESMDELQALVAGYFGKLADQFPSDDAGAEHISSILPTLYPSVSPTDWQGPQRLHVVPVAQVHAIELQFPMPEILTKYRSKPTQYLSHLLGHEGKGSLLSLLKAKHYATDLYADDSSKSCTSFSVLTVRMEVTEIGLQNVDEIVSMVFAYVELLKSTGAQQWIFDEVRTVADIRFKFLSQRNPFDYACSVAGWMQLFTPENASGCNGTNDPNDLTNRAAHYLSGPYKVFEWKPELVEECLASLNPDNLFLMVSSPTFGSDDDEKEGEEKDGYESERWYGTKYKNIPCDESTMKKWKSAKHQDYPELQLPEVNDMIATDFELLDLKDSPAEYPKDQPQCIHHDDNVLLFYKPDNVFEQPKVVISYSFSSGQGSISPELAVATHLYTELVQEQCNEFSYQATMAGLYCDVNPSSNGLEVHVTGYNHKAHVLLERLVDTMMGMLPDGSKEGTSSIDQELFNRVSFKIGQMYQQFLVGQPYSHAIYGGDLLLEHQKCSIQDKMNVLQQISLNEVLTLARGFWKNCQMTGLVHGNVSAQHAYDISKMVWDKTHPTHPLSDDGSTTITRAPLERRVVRLTPDDAQLGRSSRTPPGFLYRFRGFNEENPNSAVEVVFQMGALSLPDNATLAMINQLVREPAFNQLRTDEQLGYIVHSSIKTSGDNIKGLLFLIQSDAFDPIHVENRIEHFLSGFRKRLVDMSDEEFQTNIDSLVVSFLEKNKNLGEESSRYWHVILNKTYQFQRLKIIASHVKELSKERVIRFFDRYIAPGAPHRQKLCVTVVAKQHEEALGLGDAAATNDGTSKTKNEATEEEQEEQADPSPVILISDPNEFKRSMTLFPMPPKVDIDVVDLGIQKK
mmetsp:Transcript_41918/g.100697  ORF Transcript_41918/g.100697 Transcript_41918/m.100697 type:complete len:1075 (+) Transcript_41918:137-3361(+)